ncbi:MAG: serine/threonine protein kinase [Pirellulales bacterium]|nr:serine/threonine protein kinase [Pirellulales bacterium]
MQEQVTAVEPNGNKSMEFSVDEPGDSPSPGRPAAKFVYPGGSRPLSGYTIKRGIGHGGFGEIYYALSDAGKEVALKLIRRNLDVELRGIRHCLNLKHPNLLDLYDIRQDDEGDTWVVMEYISEGCLADALADYPNGMPADRALAWFHGIAAGVAHLHDRGIVHRDLKPGNIFSDDGLVKVGDYGLSKFVSCSRRSGQTESVGTVHYMAPEVANGRYGKEIDIYALGIVLYEMLTGRVPFEGESVGEVLMKHLTAKPDVSGLAEPYRSVIARALEKDPAQRFRTVSEMLAALPQPAHTPPGAARLPSGTHRAAGGAGAAGAAGGAGAVPPPFPEGIIEAEAVDEEPILKAVCETWSKLCTAWNDANLPAPVKILLLVAVIVVLLVNAGVLVPLTVVLVIMYAGYRLVRAMVLPQHRHKFCSHRADVAPTPSAEPPQAVQPQAAPRQSPFPPRYDPKLAITMPGRRGRRHREQATPALVVKPPRERFTELIRSLLAGALVAIAMCVVLVLVNSYCFSFPVRPDQYAWLVLVSIAGTWAVLIPSKFWEGTRGEVILRRFIQMVIGMGLGAVAFATSALLMVHPPADGGYGNDFHLLPRAPAGFYDAYGHPMLLAYLACFGSLYFLMRWWRQADPLRGTRLSLWSVFLTVVVAAIVGGFWSFPQSWLMTVAVAISASVQIASPWLPPRKRFRRNNV